MNVQRAHYWTVAKLGKLTADQRRELRGKLARQERSRDAEHRAQAGKVLTMLREAEAVTLSSRVDGARAFLAADGGEPSAARRLADAKAFLRRP
ncbi:MAG: hypothetical protein JWM93_65 [Frankiales bacterium]|nr:hypothetical protein [Frankiales bacterium]